MSTQIIIGRDKQLQRLKNYYNQMLSGENRLCFVTGVAGSGKTFLVDYFLRECIDRNEVVVAQGVCNKHAGKAEAYFPFLEILKSFSTAIGQTGQNTENQTSLLFKNFGKAFADILIDQAPDLLGNLIPGGSIVIKAIKKVYENSNSVSKLDHVLNKNTGVENTIDTNKIQFQFAQSIRALSEMYPLVLCIDDLHWSDDESLDLLYYLARKLEGCQVMLLCSYRRNDLLAGRGERHSFISMTNELKRYYGDIWIDLDKMQECDAAHFTRELLDTRNNNFTEEFHQSFCKHTSGHPLFSVELIRHFIENGIIRKNDAGQWEADDKLEWSSLPPKVEGIIEERIGRLDEELRDILNISSVEGGTFSVPVVAQILGIPEPKLLKLLSTELANKHQLVEEEDTKKVGDCWMTHYRFIHVLFQQHLYNALTTRERIIAHNEIANALEVIYGDDNVEVAALLAYHFDQGRSFEKALPFYFKAGKRASFLCGYSQAIRLFERGLKIIEILDGEGFRDLELDLKIQYGIALKAVKGWDNKEVLDVFLEADEIAEELGRSTEIGPALFSLWGGYLIKLDLDRAMNIAIRMQQSGKRTGDNLLEMQAHLALSDTFFWMGRFEEGLAHNDRYYALCDRDKQTKMISTYGQDSSVLADMYEMLHCCMLGRFVRSEDRLSKLDRAMKRIKHPYSQVIGLVALAWGAYQLERFTDMDQYALTIIDLATKNNFDYYLGYGQLFRAIAMALDGDHTEGLLLLDEAADRIRSGQDAWLNRSLYGVIKTSILVAQGAFQHAAEVAQRIVSLSLEKKDFCYLPELLRLESLAFDHMDNSEKADELLQSAIEMARKMGANMFFQRAAEQQVSWQRADNATVVLEEARARMNSAEKCSSIETDTSIASI
jgi:AAA+ ATPase superfamily predicted ATPase